MNLTRPRAFAFLLVPVLSLPLAYSSHVGSATAAASASVRLQQIHMVTSSLGWATAGHRLLRTTDGADTWNTVPSISVGPHGQTPGFALATLGLSSVWLAAPDTGQHCAVFRSFDTGSHWQLYLQTIVATACGTGAISSFQFVSRTRGWLMATCCAAISDISYSEQRTAALTGER